MKKKLLFGLLILTLVTLPLLTACGGAEPTPTPKTPTPTAATPTPAGPANWWDELGEPEYGGTFTFHRSRVMPDLGPYTNWVGLWGCYLETLVKPSWTANRGDWPFKTVFTPDEYYDGMLAESWEMTDPTTMIFHIRKGVYWQDKPPVNGREFNAYDVQEHYDKILGKGKYTEPSMYTARLTLWDKVNALDEYTVEFKFAYPSAQAFLSVAEPGGQNHIPAPEWTALPDNERGDWRNAVGTGAWILTDYVDGSSITYSRNPNYWGYDERYPDNQLPYADELKALIIPDVSTAIAALRTGKIDLMRELTWMQAGTLKESNPELLQVEMPFGGGGLQPRYDHEPFTDIRVRKAMQMALDREAIAQSYYGGTVDGIPSGVVNPSYKGYAFAYEDWPEALKAEYSYNPERARELLAEAGYPNGFDTHIWAGSSADTSLLQIMQAQLLDIGIDMEIRVMDDIALQSFTRGRQHEQLSGGSCARTFSPEVCCTAYNTTDMANYGCVSDPEYDTLFRSYQNSTDSEEARQLIVAMDRYGLEHHFTIMLFPTYNYTVYQPYIKGYSGELISIEGGPNGHSGWLWARLWIEKD